MEDNAKWENLHIYRNGETIRIRRNNETLEYQEWERFITLIKEDEEWQLATVRAMEEGPDYKGSVSLDYIEDDEPTRNHPYSHVALSGWKNIPTVREQDICYYAPSEYEGKPVVIRKHGDFYDMQVSETYTAPEGTRIQDHLKEARDKYSYLEELLISCHAHMGSNGNPVFTIEVTGWKSYPPFRNGIDPMALDYRASL